MRNNERVPVASGESQFPVGDISDFNKQMGANWLRMVDELEGDERKQYLRDKYTPWTSRGIDWIYTQAGAEQLCIAWDQAGGDDLKLASAGQVVARAFMNDTGVMPNYEANLQSWLNEMQVEGPNPGEFATNVLSGMQISHPKLFELYNELYEKCRHWYSLRPEHEDRFRAGMAVPYMLSSTSRMVRQASDANFTSMSNEKHDLNTAEFEQLFTANGPLAYVSSRKVQQVMQKAEEWLPQHETVRRIVRTKVSPFLGAAAGKLEQLAKKRKIIK